MVDHTAAGRPAYLKNAATVPPPIPMCFAFSPVTLFIALARVATTGESAGVGGAQSPLGGRALKSLWLKY